MATGDDAVAAGYTLTLGTVQAKDIDSEINRLADWVAARTSTVLPLSKGGTNATNAAAARTNLGAAAASHTHTISDILTTGGTSYGAALQGVLDSKADTSAVSATFANYVNKAGDTMSGHLWVPNAVGATSSFTVAYINGDGRLSRGTSSEKYKKFISEVDPLEQGDIFPQLHKFQMRQGDGSWQLGYIAERLDENEDTKRFVVRIDGEIESIDFIQLLLAQNAQLNARLTALENDNG